jgi:multidrug resistance efflux pump
MDTTTTTKPKRYDLDRGTGYSPCPSMEERPDGDYVRADDYDAMASRLAAVTEQLAQIERETAQGAAELTSAHAAMAALGEALAATQADARGLAGQVVRLRNLLDEWRLAYEEGGATIDDEGRERGTVLDGCDELQERTNLATIDASPEDEPATVRLVAAAIALADYATDSNHDLRDALRLVDEYRAARAACGGGK